MFLGSPYIYRSHRLPGRGDADLTGEALRALPPCGGTRGDWGKGVQDERVPVAVRTELKERLPELVAQFADIKGRLPEVVNPS